METSATVAAPPVLKRLLAAWLRKPLVTRWVLIGWAALAIAGSVKSFVQPNQHTVFPAFADAARHWWADEPLYETAAYYYGPTFAVLMTPFAPLSDSLGGAIWCLGSVTLLGWSARRFFREVMTNEPLSATAEACLMGLTLIGAIRGVWSGQSNALLLALALLGAVELLRRRGWRSAWLLALPIHIKIWPVLAGALLSTFWPKTLLPKLATATVLLALLPLATKAPVTVEQRYYQWARHLADRQADGIRWSGYRDAWTVWEQFQTPVNREGYQALQVLTGVGVLAWCLRQRRLVACDRQLVNQTLAMWAAWQLLFGPGTERLTYILLAPWLAWAVVKAFSSGRLRLLTVASFALTYLLGTGGIERLLVRQFPAAVALEPLGVVLFGAWLIADAWQTSMGVVNQPAGVAGDGATSTANSLLPWGAPAQGAKP